MGMVDIRAGGDILLFLFFWGRGTKNCLNAITNVWLFL